MDWNDRRLSNDPGGRSLRRRRAREVGGPGGEEPVARWAVWRPPESMATRKKRSRRHFGTESGNRKNSVAEIRHRGRSDEPMAKIETSDEPVLAGETVQAGRQELRPARQQGPEEGAAVVIGGSFQKNRRTESDRIENRDRQSEGGCEPPEREIVSACDV